jgi:hypothetical protein
VVVDAVQTVRFSHLGSLPESSSVGRDTGSVPGASAGTITLDDSSVEGSQLIVA